MGRVGHPEENRSFFGLGVDRSFFGLGVGGGSHSVMFGMLQKEIGTLMTCYNDCRTYVHMRGENKYSIKARTDKYAQASSEKERFRFPSRSTLVDSSRELYSLCSLCYLCSSTHAIKQWLI